MITLTCRQLYDEIWEISVAGVAKKYGVPYAQLMKQVKEAGIPIPPSGYWTKVNFEKPVTKIALTEPFDEMVSLSGAVTLIPKGADETETLERYGQTFNVYNRETLYQEVWESPVTEVAKRYEVSDAAIHKVCKALEIPTPSRGYWAKKHAGQSPPIVPLPKNEERSQKLGIRTGQTSQPKIEGEALAFLDEEEKMVIFSVASQVLLPDENARMHTKIIAHRKVIAEWKKQPRSDGRRARNRRDSDSPPYLTDSISAETLPRVLRLIDALIKALEPLDGALTDSLGFVISGETVRLHFSESKDKVPHVPTKEENMALLKYEEDRKRYSWASKPQIRKYDHVHNGKLSVSVGGQRSYRDCKSYIVEDRLGDIMIEMYQEAENLKRARKEREEAEHKRQEEARRKEELRKQYDAEVDRTQALVNCAEDYEVACKIRRYISAIEADGSLKEKTEDWLEWAMAKADWYDPTVATEDEFFGKRQHTASTERKMLKHKGYGW